MRASLLLNVLAFVLKINYLYQSSYERLRTMDQQNADDPTLETLKQIWKGEGLHSSEPSRKHARKEVSNRDAAIGCGVLILWTEPLIPDQ